MTSGLWNSIIRNSSGSSDLNRLGRNSYIGYLRAKIGPFLICLQEYQSGFVNSVKKYLIRKSTENSGLKKVRTSHGYLLIF